MVASEKTEAVLLALAERCEAATVPDRLLDQDILEAGWKTGQRRTDLGPQFTASIDAALTLVPNDLAFGMKRAPCQRTHAMLATIGQEWNGAGATPALAICAAALKALAATPKESI
jgi:hypothetical protein